MKKDSKQRLFEVMGRLDKTFKPKLNESDDPCWDGYEQYGTKEKDGKEVPNCVPTNEELNLQEQQTRPIYDIAQEIYQDWRPVHQYAAQYLDAMTSLNSIDDRYMFDSGREIVGKFLSNASSWRGETAKRIKAELKKMLGLRENSRLNETGEWIGDEDDVAWMEALKSEVQKIESETGGKLKLKDVRGFDKYQGPYAIVDIEGRIYRIWTVGSEYGNDMLWIENYPVDNTSQMGANAGFMGTTGAIVDMLKTNENKLNEDKSWFEEELGYLKNNQTFTRVELRDILETLYKNVDISGQYRIMNLLELFGMDENFR